MEVRCTIALDLEMMMARRASPRVSSVLDAGLKIRNQICGRNGIEGWVRALHRRHFSRILWNCTQSFLQPIANCLGAALYYKYAQVSVGFPMSFMTLYDS